ncbi:efflux RND transporter periplasmic adaptor subunit [Microvirga sp. STR05]|uniref:Efflux RND transporter periplasmic adaptor subunit n=1 Tax=Hymenobacter duratus TaxID=2771356 RepID=A0ABR8JG15_9BACT|nr:efflux RND transporter periplasmic adaptor subunit [Hymenobacter duratus]MBD2714340.1 efflux RND transporter periplasmic adaptor subunit [Hymenobacter duratus]MBR7949243.1 efflux RND transporter periplasmic adaptor subunit [Microvirga sp. STR05]
MNSSFFPALTATLRQGLPALLGAAFLAGCTADGKDQSAATQAVPMLPVTTLKFSEQELFHDYVADVQAVRNVEVRAQVGGFLEHIYVDEGRTVKKGQPLFRINASAYQNQLNQARATVSGAEAQARAARLEMERVKLLVDKNVIAKTELALSQTKVKDADARVADARTQEAAARLKLSFTLVKAPFDGIIDRIPLKVGSMVEEGTLLTTVSDLRSVFAYFNVAEGEYLEYVKARQRHPERHTDSVSLTLADGSLYPLAGHIETTESEFNASTGSLAFRARFDNPKQLLKHGASGRIRLTNKLPEALLVPQKAVFEIQDKNYVYVVDSANQVHMRNFKPQTRTGLFYVVKDGLKPGEKIVYEGTTGLKNGQKIRPRLVQPDSVLAYAH